jgi:hypothetical protein
MISAVGELGGISKWLKLYGGYRETRLEATIPGERRCDVQ